VTAPVRELTAWEAGGAEPGRFPYAAVVAAFQRTGKQHVDRQLLAHLDRIRATAATDPALRDFLGVALDKWDGEYDYRSYLALRLLPLPVGPAGDGTRQAADRLLVHLVADALAFERDAAAGRTDLLPRQRPEPDRVAKRLRLGRAAVAHARARLGRPVAPTEAERQALARSMWPVDTVHDEYLFIRVLQAYETVFALVAVELRAAVEDLAAGRTGPAAGHLDQATAAVDEAAPLFSLLATMRPESFRTFRVHTEGASAIQSRAYKLVEALCRTPDEARLASPAFGSVPEVRDRVRAGHPTIAGLVAQLGTADLDAPMAAFAAALGRWRRTHYRLATRMLGTRSGTGYTEGTPYLAAARTIPVFTRPAGGDAR